MIPKFQHCYFFLLISCLSVASSTDFKTCQTPNPASPFAGCPPNTLFVSPTNTLANFTHIQDAVASLPNDTTLAIILVDAGKYIEQVNVTRIGPTTLLGTTDDPSTVAANVVEVNWAAANSTQTILPDNAYTATLTVASDLNSSLTGSGPSGFPVPADTPLGSCDFRAYNLNITNTFLPYSAGPSLALSASRANTSFYHTYLASYQDTIYIGKLGNSYMSHCVIAGQTDFLYGFGTLYIANSTLQLRSCGGGIAAWKGTNTTTTFPNKYGAYIAQSALAAENASVAQTNLGKCALGRPWNSLHRSVFMACHLDATVDPAGYIPWAGHAIIPGQTLLAEHHDRGPGFNLTARQVGNITTELTDAQVAPYRWPRDVFLTPDGGAPSAVRWIDPQYIVP